MTKKMLLIILDGLGDRGHPDLNGMTPLQAAHTPTLDLLAEQGATGLFHPAMLGQALPSEMAHFALFGYGPEDFPGRGALEALGAGIRLEKGQVAFLAHLVCAQHKENHLVVVQDKPDISPPDLAEIVRSIACFKAEDIDFRFIPTHLHYGLLIASGPVSRFVSDTNPMTEPGIIMRPLPLAGAPDPKQAMDTAQALERYLSWSAQIMAELDLNRKRLQLGKPAVSFMVTQRPGQLKTVPPILTKLGLKAGTIASGLVYKGLAKYLGLCHIDSPASQDPKEDLLTRLHLARKHLDNFDLIHVHSKWPDVAGHKKDPEHKKRVIEELDQALSQGIEYFLKDPRVIIAVTADHSTPCEGELIHSGEPVPLCLCGPGVRKDRIRKFDETEVAGGALGLIRSREFSCLVLNYLDRAKLMGLMDNGLDLPYWPGPARPFPAAGCGATACKGKEPASSKTDGDLNMTDIPYPVGVIHGRFQVLHLDHLRYLLAGKRLCRHLVVGITNPEPMLTREDPADPKRSLSQNNPLTYFERLVMVREALFEAGCKADEFTITPFPINHPERYCFYLPLKAVFFLSIYDDWGRRKLAMFNSLGLKTHVLWEVPLSEKGLSASDIRKSIVRGDNWEAAVPKSTAKLVKQWQLKKRLLQSGGGRPSPVG